MNKSQEELKQSFIDSMDSSWNRMLKQNHAYTRRLIDLIGNKQERRDS